MPLGNGDIGLNAWVEEDGDLLVYIGKSDAPSMPLPRLRSNLWSAAPLCRFVLATKKETLTTKWLTMKGLV